MAYVASKRVNSIRLLKPQTPANPFPFLRRISSETDPLPPPLKITTEIDPIVSQVVELLQPSVDVWNTDKLRHLLFPNADTPPSPPHLLQITRQFDSSTKAFKFLEWLRANKPQEVQETYFLSCTFQFVSEFFSREPKSEEKLYDLFKISKDWNVPITINFATHLVRQFGRARMVDRSLHVYEHLHPNLRNTHIRNAIIDILMRSGRIRDALIMLDEMFEPDVKYKPNYYTADIVFGALFGKIDCGRIINDEKIVELVLKLGKNDVFLNSIRLTQLITKLCKSKKSSQAWDVLMEVVKLGGSVEVTSCNALLSSLGHESNFKKMNLLLSEMKKMEIEPNVVTFGILINYLCKNRRVDEALEVLEKMKGGEDEVIVQPDAITYNTLIDGLCKVGRQEEGLGLMEKMKSEPSCAPTTVTYNCLIDGFCKSGEIERSITLFEEMNKVGVSPNVITLNTMVDGMCKNGRISRAIEFFHNMQEKGIKGNAVTYTTFITAFCNSNNVDKAINLFNEMLNSGCSPDAIVYYTLISGLTLAGKLDDANSIAKKLKEAGFSLDIASYNTLIGGFCKKNKLEQVHEMLEEMEEMGIKPDTITYNTLISYFSKMGDFKSAYKVMNKMSKEGMVPTIVTYGALIHAYCINDKLEEAMKVFKNMSSTSRVPPNTVIYNILIDALCKNHDVETAISLMDDMKVKSVRRNITTYNAMFKGLQEKNLLDKAFEFMDEMTEEACNPDYVTMEILTQWFSAVGETEKLKRFVQGYEVGASKLSVETA